MSHLSNIVIVASVRTPMGGFQGELSGFSACQLGVTAVNTALQRSGLAADRITDLIMGCVLPAGLGQAPARQVCRGAGLSDSVHTMTINKVCGSGMKSVMLAASQLMTGESNAVVAGGMESMTNAPYLLEKVRKGLRLGHGEIKDHMFLDGLEDAYDKQLMGYFAEQTAVRFKFSREAMDDFAIASLERARHAQQNGWFDDEIAAITTPSGVQISQDEQPLKARPEKIRQLRPAFARDGAITAANSSSISDGAAALVLMREDDAIAQGFQPLARIAGFTSHSRMPAEFTIAPVTAIHNLFQTVGWQTDEVDLFEINEAFAVVTMAVMQELKLDHDKVNVFGGACALGHPLGASGARILVTLLNALAKTGGHKGVASLCIGGGEATALAVELL